MFFLQVWGWNSHGFLLLLFSTRNLFPLLVSDSIPLLLTLPSHRFFSLSFVFRQFEDHSLGMFFISFNSQINFFLFWYLWVFDDVYEDSWVAISVFFTFFKHKKAKASDGRDTLTLLHFCSSVQAGQDCRLFTALHGLQVLYHSFPCE